MTSSNKKVTDTVTGKNVLAFTDDVFLYTIPATTSDLYAPDSACGKWTMADFNKRFKTTEKK